MKITVIRINFKADKHATVLAIDMTIIHVYKVLSTHFTSFPINR